MEEQKEVIVDKEKLLKAVESFELEKTIHVPELSSLLNLPEEECYLKVKGASFEDHIRAMELQKQPYRMVRNLVDKLKENPSSQDAVNLGKLFLDPEISEQTVFDLTIFQRCVIEPKLTFEEVVELSKVAPEVINRVTSEIIQITSVEK